MTTASDFRERDFVPEAHAGAATWAADGLDGRRPSRPGEVKRLGDAPTVMALRVGGVTIEVAAKDDDSEHLLGPYDDRPLVPRSLDARRTDSGEVESPSSN